MFALNQVFYTKEEVFLILAGDEKRKVIPYRFKSTTISLISEEISTFLKEAAQTSFLHSSDFEHWNISDKFMVLPMAVYDPQHKHAYWERMFGLPTQDRTLEETSHKALKIHFLYAVPVWLNTYLKLQFNKQHSSSFYGEILKNVQGFGIQAALLITSDSFVFTIYTEKELHYFDISPYQSVDDILYTMLHVMHRQKWSMENNPLAIYGFCSSALLESLKTEIRKITELKGFKTSEFINCYP